MLLIALFAAGVVIPVFMPSWKALGLCALGGAGVLFALSLQRRGLADAAPWFSLLTTGFVLGLAVRSALFFHGWAAEDRAIRRSLPRELPQRWRDY